MSLPPAVCRLQTGNLRPVTLLPGGGSQVDFCSCPFFNLLFPPFSPPSPFASSPSLSPQPPLFILSPETPARIPSFADTDMEIMVVVARDPGGIVAGPLRGLKHQQVWRITRKWLGVATHSLPPFRAEHFESAIAVVTAQVSEKGWGRITGQGGLETPPPWEEL